MVLIEVGNRRTEKKKRQKEQTFRNYNMTWDLVEGKFTMTIRQIVIKMPAVLAIGEYWSES